MKPILDELIDRAEKICDEINAHNKYYDHLCESGYMREEDYSEKDFYLGYYSNKLNKIFNEYELKSKYYLPLG